MDKAFRRRTEIAIYLIMSIDVSFSVALTAAIAKRSARFGGSLETLNVDGDALQAQPSLTESQVSPTRHPAPVPCTVPSNKKIDAASVAERYFFDRRDARFERPMHVYRRTRV